MYRNALLTGALAFGLTMWWIGCGGDDFTTGTSAGGSPDASLGGGGQGGQGGGPHVEAGMGGVGTGGTGTGGAAGTAGHGGVNGGGSGGDGGTNIGGAAGAGGQPGPCDLSASTQQLVVEEDGPCAEAVSTDPNSTIGTGTGQGSGNHYYAEKAEWIAPNYVHAVFWRFDVKQTGRYRLEAYVPAGAESPLASYAQYKVVVDGQGGANVVADKVCVSQADAGVDGGWLDMGDFFMTVGGKDDRHVRLGDYSCDQAGCADPNAGCGSADVGRYLVFDAIRVSWVSDN